MGILDDAIREHLELKRKHGVSEEELQRQEEEALGPARRDVAHQHEQTVSEPGHTATAESDEPAAAETALFDLERAEASGSPVEAEPTPVEPPHVEPPPGEAELPDEDELDEDETDFVADEREPDEDELLAPQAEGGDFDEEELEDEDVDVLEDTPDFLQETPEHDRLWFEQKPPRDFDFD